MDWITHADWAVALLRVVTGVTLAAHGYGKIFLGGRLAGTAGWFDSIGMRPGWLHARMAAATEIGAGLLFAIGLLTSLAGAGMVALMAVAAWTVHRKNGFFIVAMGWEYNLVLAVIGAAVAIGGAGRLSVDSAIWGGSGILTGWAGLLVIVVLGVGGAAVHLAVFYRPATTSTPAG
jgi:putative oxidoreductase